MSQPAAEWFVENESGRAGPFPPAALRQMANQGQINPETLIWRADLKAPVPAKSIRGLFPSPSSPPVSTLADEDFVREVLHETDDTPPASPAGDDYRHYQIPLSEFPHLTRERVTLIVLGWIFTVSGMLSFLNGCFEFYEMTKQEDDLARKTYSYIVAASISAGIIGIATGSLLRTVAGAIDLGVYISKLLYDIRKQGRWFRDK